MSHELICSWLGLAPGEWPPNHYRLLGLEPGESDTALIEQRVHQRLDAVRRYQMMHPEPATEAMNRLAQAFVCLTEPTTKRHYDTTVLGLPVPVEPQPTTQTAVLEPPPVRAPSSGRSTPFPLPSSDTQVIVVSENDTVVPVPPVRRPAPDTMTAPAVPETLPPEAVAPSAQLSPAEPPPLEAPPPAEPPDLPPVRQPETPTAPRIDPAIELAGCEDARRGLGSRAAFLRRLRQVWRLLHLWQDLGKYLSLPRKRLPRPAEAGPLIELLTKLSAELEGFPPILGEAGQPGYHVVGLAEDLDRPLFHTFDLELRKSLSRDWQSGWTLLTAHRDFLFSKLTRLRRRGWLHWAYRSANAFVNERPALILIGLAVAAISVAVFRLQLLGR
jgi:hypothetical protein